MHNFIVAILLILSPSPSPTWPNDTTTNGQVYQINYYHNCKPVVGKVWCHYTKPAWYNMSLGHGDCFTSKYTVCQFRDDLYFCNEWGCSQYGYGDPQPVLIEKQEECSTDGNGGSCYDPYGYHGADLPNEHGVWQWMPDNTGILVRTCLPLRATCEPVGPWAIPEKDMVLYHA